MRIREGLAHLPIVTSDPVRASARLKLGRAFALSGDVTKGKAAYRVFLELRKNADTDIPILKQAQASQSEIRQAVTSDEP